MTQYTEEQDRKVYFYGCDEGIQSSPAVSEVAKYVHYPLVGMLNHKNKAGRDPIVDEFPHTIGPSASASNALSIFSLPSSSFEHVGVDEKARQSCDARMVSVEPVGLLAVT